MVEPILFFAVTIAFINYTALIDAELINDKIFITDHSSRVYQRATFFLSIGIFNLIYCVAAIFIFIALFDQILNLKRNLPFFYLGTIAKWDVYFRTRPVLFVTVKVVALCFGLLLFVLGGSIFSFIIQNINQWF